MARRKEGTEASAGTVRAGFRTFASNDAGFKELNPGDSISGVFVSRRKQIIRDSRTRSPKEILVYRLRTDEDGIVNIGGRTMLDRQFEDILDDMFLGRLDDMKGLRLVINRGSDSRTRDGNPIGQYEILVEDRTGEHGHIGDE